MALVSPQYEGLLARLEALGRRPLDKRPHEQDEQWAAEFGLGPQDVPGLIEIARLWATRQEWPKDENDQTVYAPIHAWRALGGLHAVEAVGPLLELLDLLDKQGDDWFLEELPHVLAQIGPGALEPVAAHLADKRHSMYSRIAAADAVKNMAYHHPAQYARAVAILTEQLGRHAEEDPSFNGFLVADLLDLGATESAEVIERAFADDDVDEDIAGDWGVVRRELGVPGMGLAPERARRPSPRDMIEVFRRIGEQEGLSEEELLRAGLTGPESGDAEWNEHLENEELEEAEDIEPIDLDFGRPPGHQEPSPLQAGGKRAAKKRAQAKRDRQRKRRRRSR